MVLFSFLLKNWENQGTERGIIPGWVCAGPLPSHSGCPSIQSCPPTWRPSQALSASSSSRRTLSVWSSCLTRASSRLAASASWRNSSSTSGAGSPGGAVALAPGSRSGHRDPREAAAARFQASRAAPAAAAARNTAAPHRASTRQARPGSGPSSAMPLSTALSPDGHEYLIGTLGIQDTHGSAQSGRGFPSPLGGAGSLAGARPGYPSPGQDWGSWVPVLPLPPACCPLSFSLPLCEVGMAVGPAP